MSVGRSTVIVGSCAAVVAAAMLGVTLRDDRRQAVAVRVGQRQITVAEVEHWMTVFAPRRQVPDPPAYTRCARELGRTTGAVGRGQAKLACRRRYQSLRRRALDYLIKTRWLIAQAEEEGMPISGASVQARLRKVEIGYRGSRSSLASSLRLVGQTLDDLRLEISGKLAESLIRARILSNSPRVTESEVVSYYHHNPARFKERERRGFYIVEFLKGLTWARRVRAELESGKLTFKTSPGTLHEAVDRPRSLQAARPIIKAIFAGVRGVLSRPVLVEGDFYFLVEVNSIRRARQRSLAEEAKRIRGTLEGTRRRRALETYIRSWRARWVERTECRPGYVVQKCRQYNGRHEREDPLAFA